MAGKESEVKFHHHGYEFNRFYTRQKFFCQRLFGIYNLIYYKNYKEIQIEIKRSNFYNGIKLTHSFVIDNLQYITNPVELREIEESLEKLSDDFILDEKYNYYMNIENSGGSLPIDQEADYQRKYFEYLLRCVNIYNRLLFNLQETVILNYNSMRKIVYQDARAFFESLAYFRDEVANDIAGFRLSDVFDKMKSILAYVFTYRVFMFDRKYRETETIIEKILSFCLSEEMTLNILRAKNGTLNEEETKNYRQVSKKIFKVLVYIYRMVNDSLVDRNILPKPKKYELVDKTTM